MSCNAVWTCRLIRTFRTDIQFHYSDGNTVFQTLMSAYESIRPCNSGHQQWRFYRRENLVSQNLTHYIRT
jgi:hypothetical protein